MATCQLTIFAGDHGLAAEGVSAYPQRSPGRCCSNFLAGNAAANVFARSVGAALRVVDAGVAGEPVAHPDLLSRRIGAGTRNSLTGPAMTRRRARRARSPSAARSAPTAPGTPSPSARWASATPPPRRWSPTSSTGLPLDRLVGRGTGLDDAGLARKRAVLARAAARTADRASPRARRSPSMAASRSR